jgi:hypothetical protein
MLARWQCEKVDQVNDPGRMQKGKTRRKWCAKRGYSALLCSAMRAVPFVVVIVMHMSRIAFGFVSCFFMCRIIAKLQFKIIHP